MHVCHKCSIVIKVFKVVIFVMLIVEKLLIFIVEHGYKDNILSFFHFGLER